MSAPSNFDILRLILDRSESEHMPGSRWQDPKIEIRKDVERPYYFIRPYVPRLTPAGALERKQQRMQIGFVDKTTTRQAKAVKEQIMSQINAGKFFVQAQIPFGIVVEKYLITGLPLLGSNTRNKYAGAIENHIRPAFTDLRMCDIDRVTVAAFLRQKEADGLAHWTMLDLRNIGSAIFTFAHEQKLFQGENPWIKQKVKGAAAKEKPLPSAEALIRFLSALPNTSIISADGARLIVLTAIATGSRVSEVLGLQPRDLIGETLKIERRYSRGDLGPTKTAASRRIREIPGLAADLRRYAANKAPTDYIFTRPDTGEPLDDRHLQQHILMPAAKAAGIWSKGFGMHRFRHLHLSWIQEEGATPFEAMRYAGHSKMDMTWQYTITDSQRERVHVEKLLQRLEIKATGGVQ